MFASALALAAPAFADEDAVVVTATRFPQKQARASDRGHRHYAGTNREQHGATLPELLSRYAGIHTRNNSGSPDVAIDLRGFGASGDQNTLVLLDGQRLNEIDLTPTQLSAIPLDAIERVEIQRGGGAVLYGGGATGGTVNIITRGPRRGERSGAVYAGAGSYASDEARANLNAAGDDLGLSLSASHQGGDGYRRNNRLRQDGIAGDLRLFGDRSGLAMKFGGDEQRLGLPGPRDENQLTSDPRGATNPSDWSAQNGSYVTLQGRTDFGRVELAADLGQRDQRSAANYRSLASYLDIKTRSTTFSPRLRWTGAPRDLDTSVVAGIDFADWDYHRRIAGSAAIADPFSRTDGTQSSRAIYVQGNVMVRAATKLSVGLRSQQVRNELGNSFGGAGVPQDQTRTVSAGEFGVHHALTERLAVFGKLGTSFRFATVDENGYTASGQFLEPQKARQGEAGSNTAKMERGFVPRSMPSISITKSTSARWWCHSARTRTCRRRGARDWRSRGAQRCRKTLTSAGNIAWQSARFQRRVRGRRRSRARHSPGAAYPRDAAPGVAGDAEDERVGHGEPHRRAALRRRPANTYPGTMPAYSVADVKLVHETGGWTLSAIAANLFDKRYYSYAIVDSFACATRVCAYPQVGRTLFVSAQYRFR